MNYLISIDHTQGVGEEREVTTFWNDSTKKVERKTTYTWSDLGEGGTPIETLPMNPSIQSKVDTYQKNRFDEQVQKQFEQSQSECNEFNERKPYQNKGQVVSIIKGRKFNGEKGVVFWEGYDRYSNNSDMGFKASTILAIINDGKPKASKFNRIGVRLNDEETVFVNTDYVKVVEGFIPVTVTKEDIVKLVLRRNENFRNLFSC